MRGLKASLGDLDIDSAVDGRDRGFRAGTRVLAIASGVVEASGKTIVGQRLKQAGMHWTRHPDYQYNRRPAASMPRTRQPIWPNAVTHSTAGALRA